MPGSSVPSSLVEILELLSLSLAGAAAVGRTDVSGPLGALVAKLSAELEEVRLKDAGVVSLDGARRKKRP
jgi:hypothetical protein